MRWFFKILLFVLSFWLNCSAPVYAQYHPEWATELPNGVIKDLKEHNGKLYLSSGVKLFAVQKNGSFTTIADSGATAIKFYKGSLYCFSGYNLNSVTYLES